MSDSKKHFFKCKPGGFTQYDGVMSSSKEATSEQKVDGKEAI